MLGSQARVTVAADAAKAKNARLSAKGKKRIKSLRYKYGGLMTANKDVNDLVDIDLKYNKTTPPLSYLINCARRSQQKSTSCSATMLPNPGNLGFRSGILRLPLSSGLPYELFMISPNVAHKAQRTLS